MHKIVLNSLITLYYFVYMCLWLVIVVFVHIYLFIVWLFYKIRDNAKKLV